MSRSGRVIPMVVLSLSVGLLAVRGPALAGADAEWDAAERTSAQLRAAQEAADSAAIRMRHSGVFGKVGRVEAAAKDAGARLAALWERDRAMREREKEQREREAGERAREQRR